MTSERVKKTFYHQGLSPLMHAHVTSVSGHILPTVQGLLIFPATPLRILCVCDLRVMGVPEFPWLCQSGLSLQCGHLESRLSNAGFVELAAVSCSPRHLIKFSIHGLQLESSLFSSRCLHTAHVWAETRRKALPWNSHQESHGGAPAQDCSNSGRLRFHP